jgi:hypothetical protein
MDLLNDVYRNDEFFLKIKEIYEKYKNHTRLPNNINHIVDNKKDIIFLRLKVNFTKFPNILINQLTEINFKCKDCFKVFLLMYRQQLKENNLTFSCKKEFLRKIIKVNRVSFERALNELQEKNMILVEKENAYFYFTLNLSFQTWNLSEDEKERILKNLEREIELYEEKYILNDDSF